jgi:hypothetical protein
MIDPAIIERARAVRGTFSISNSKVIRRNSLVGSFDLALPSGLIIRGALLMESHGKRWINLPSKPYQKEDGSQGWFPLVDFSSREVRARFQAAVLPLAENALLGRQQ